MLAVFDTQVDGKVVRSPDHPAVTTPGAPGGTVDFQVKRSKGFEGMAASKDGSKLYALLEGPVWKSRPRTIKSVEGKEALRVLEFDVATEKWTGRHWKYPLEANGNAIGDFNMIDAHHRPDHRARQRRRHGDKACPEGQKRTDCFHGIGQVQARLQGRLSRRQRRRPGAQDRLHRPDEHRRPATSSRASR